MPYRAVYSHTKTVVYFCICHRNLRTLNAPNVLSENIFIHNQLSFNEKENRQRCCNAAEFGAIAFQLPS